MFRTILLALLFSPLMFSSLLAMEPLTMDSGSEKHSFWENKREGFFWYKDPVIEEEPEEKETPVASGMPAKMPTASDFTYDELWNMYPPQFQEVLDNTQHKAMVTKSVEDTRDFMLMVDLSRRRAAAFSEMATYVSSTTPQFNTLKDFPESAPGRRAYIKDRFGSVDGEMTSLRDNFALLYFYSPSCSHCREQDKILALFNNEFNWEIKKINIYTNPGLAEEFEVEVTPSIFLINKNNPSPFPISFGVVTVPELKKGIYRGVRVLQNGPAGNSVYDFQKGSAMDPYAIKNKKDIKTYGGVPGWQQ